MGIAERITVTPTSLAAQSAWKGVLCIQWDRIFPAGLLNRCHPLVALLPLTQSFQHAALVERMQFNGEFIEEVCRLNDFACHKRLHLNSPLCAVIE